MKRRLPAVGLWTRTRHPPGSPTGASASPSRRARPGSGLRGASAQASVQATPTSSRHPARASIRTRHHWAASQDDARGALRLMNRPSVSRKGHGAPPSEVDDQRAVVRGRSWRAPPCCSSPERRSRPWHSRRVARLCSKLAANPLPYRPEGLCDTPRRGCMQCRNHTLQHSDAGKSFTLAG